MQSRIDVPGGCRDSALVSRELPTYYMQWAISEDVLYMVVHSLPEFVDEKRKL